MKNLKVYKISFHRPQDSDDDIFQDLEVEDIFKKVITNDELFDGFSDENEFFKVCYIFYPDIEIKNIERCITEINKVNSSWLNEYGDITEDVLFNNKYLDIDDIIDEYIKSNLSIDDVLDKINTIGYENLSELDREILNVK